MNDVPELDAIIIADSGIDSLSGTNPLKLHIEERVGAVQVIANFLRNNGKIIEPVSGDNRFSWSSAPKLNGLYLYSFLRGKDLRIELIQNYAAEQEHFTELLSQKPKAVIISTSFIFFKSNLRRLAGEIRRKAPGVQIIAGGPFVYCSYLLLQRSLHSDYETEGAANDFLFLRTDDEPDVDLYIIDPRGENSLYRVLQPTHHDLPPEPIENSAVFDGRKYIFGPRNDDFSGDNLMAVNWDSMPQSIFKNGVIPIQASNGCPYNCAFCNFTKDRRLTFIKPVDRLFAELKAVQQRGIKYVWFVDDNFRLGRSDLDEVCRQFIRHDIKVKWMCFIRASTLRNADLDLLQKAGCIEVQIGLESGDPQILQNMNKQADPAMYTEVISRVLNQGINVSCYFITGFPGETEATALATRKFIRDIENPEAPGILSWSIYPFMLIPLSPVYEPEMRRKYDLQGYLMNWKHQTMDFRQARQLVAQAFSSLENSGPIYREDNQEMLASMPPKTRKSFFNTRNALAKKALEGPIESTEIVDTFKHFASFF